MGSSSHFGLCCGQGWLRAGLSSLNELTVHAMAMETWRAFHSQDGPDGSRNALGQVLFPSNVATRSTRSEAAGVVSPHLPYATNTLVDNGIAMWNKFPALREASTKGMASNKRRMLKIALVVAMVALGAQAGRIRPVMPKRPLGYPADKIVGGTEVEPNSIPYQVSLQYPGIDFHFCGGAIYDESTVITAAHCCAGQSPSDLRVNAGEHSLSNSDGTEQLRDVSKIIGHEDYGTPGQFSNDVCLLKLSKPLDLNGKVDAAKLPSQGDEYDSNTKIVVSGWGTLSAGGSSPDTLYSVTVPFVEDSVCDDNYFLETIDDSMICAGEEGVDSCQGDSGGPLTCDGVHCGVVSWGYGCAGRNQPGVYAQTSYFVDWIKTNA
eukprot:maker-scaffold1259_size52279-snap-gene-0.10 protein:Tk02678 transcript:maker-scaffold1259_size52279-snap-gene-0.10-mRNA-1 annotation:"anionic trypsin-1 precursor"